MAEFPPLILALCDPALHGDAEVRVVETHISWVLLAGEYAYKIKKPVEFGFLDFSTLELRRRYCWEELRLNRRLAPDLYIAVVAITGESGALSFDGTGPVVEYAVKLRRFDESCLLDRLVGTSLLTADSIDGLALDLAAFHGVAAHSTAQDGHGLPETILAAAEHNFEYLLRLFPEYQNRWEALAAWTGAEFGRLREVFWARKAAGLVRECHGDLHCGNLVLLGERLVPFDCIEFSEDLRWIDCLSETAFLFMDLEVRGRADLAWRLLNRYLATTGDYAGLAVLDFYRVYRALVRAKIAGLSLEHADGSDSRHCLETQCVGYLEYAERASQARTPTLLITHGFSGSGKSFYAARLAELLPAIRIASDIERKRLAGFEALARTGSAPFGGIYAEFFTRQTYALLLDLAEQVLRAGFNAILDATYLRTAQRHACRELAGRLGVRLLILSVQAPEAVLRARIAGRLARRDDPSEAGEAVLTRQMAGAEDLEEWEKPFVLALDTTAAMDVDAVLEAVRCQLNGAECTPGSVP